MQTQTTRAFMSKQAAGESIPSHQSFWRVWDALGQEMEYASRALQEAKRILAETEPEGPQSPMWIIGRDSNGRRFCSIENSALAEALKGFVEERR